MSGHFICEYCGYDGYCADYCRLAAARPDDQLFDLFPGTGAVAKAWQTWCGKFTLPTSPEVSLTSG